MFINDIFFMDNIFDIEKRISIQCNNQITNLSFWNPSKEYVNMIQRILPVQKLTNLFEYVYTYNIDKETRGKVIEKIIDRHENSQMCMLLPNSTLSILNIINYLKLHGYKRLWIFQPSYFSVEEACSIFKIPVTKVPLSYTNGKYEISFNLSKIKLDEAIWITSPIYSTNCYPDKKMINTINNLTASNHLVIIDESLNINGYETIRQLNLNKYLFGIYSPHKSLFINGLKFSAIICNKENDDFLEQWIDVLGGALPTSSINAVEHFLSENYDLCKSEALKWFDENKRIIIKVLRQYPFAKIDTLDSIGPYLTVNVNALSLNSLELIEELIKESFVSIIPGFLNGNRESSFRINLSLYKHSIGCSLNALLSAICQKIS